MDLATVHYFLLGILKQFTTVTVLGLTFTDNNQRHIYNFEIRDDKLFAEQDDNRYLIFDLESEDLKEFDSKEGYEKYARQNNFPLTDELKEFYYHYKDHWNGWRFWFLP